MTDTIKTHFEKRFGSDYILIQSPGRVNLLGEHTDYNDGFALPAAVNKHILLAIGINPSEEIRLFSIDKDEDYSTSTQDVKKSGYFWPDYLLGAYDQLVKKGYDITGFDCVFGGDIPIGAGMSSSAALTSGVIYGLNELLDLEISSIEIARLAQKVENNFVGLQCGIMDQIGCLMGKAKSVIQLDCRSLETNPFPFDRPDIQIVLCDSGVSRELASSEYNIRRKQCEEGVAILKKSHPEVESLRDATLQMVENAKEEMGPVIFKRCNYVVKENKRVIEACDLLNNHKFEAFGKLMKETHEGLRDDYEVSCKELDALVDFAAQCPGVLGARMMGGGFGGCTINLVAEEHVANFKETVTSKYKEAIGYEPKIYVTRISRGTHRIA